MTTKTMNYNETLEQFFNESNNEILYREVFDQIGDEAEDLLLNLPDYRNASAGVGGFIYYEETYKFANDNIDEIFDLLNEYKDSTGELPNFDFSSSTRFYNSLAWFALESFIYDLGCFIEQLEENE